MNTNVNLTVIDEYVDALLDSASAPVEARPASTATDSHAEAGSTAAATASLPVASARPVAAAVPAPAQPASATAPVLARHASSVPTSQRWLRVTVGGDSYALELLCVQEVVRLAPIVGMRGARPAVMGVMNLRGRIVPVFDLGLWLDAGCVQRDGDDGRCRIVVIERDDELIGVLVSSVEDVVTLGRDRIEPPLAGSQPGVILGIARVGDAPTVLLDANALFH